MSFWSSRDDVNETMEKYEQRMTEEVCSFASTWHEIVQLTEQFLRGFKEGEYR